MNQEVEKYKNSFLMLKALEEEDIELAIKAISSPDLDPLELSSILTISLMGLLKHKGSNETLKLHNRVVAAGTLNRMEQISRDNDIRERD